MARETAGAARTRLSLRPLVVIEGGNRRKARAHRAAGRFDAFENGPLFEN
jgi:hypothetical protein